MENSVIYRLAPDSFKRALFEIEIIERKGYIIEYNGLISVTISSFVEKHFKPGAVLGDFFSALVIVPGGIKGSSVPIKSKKTGQTVGYLFSVAGLSDPDADFEGYKAGYAKAAIEHVLFDGVGHRAVEIDEDLGNERQLSFDDLFISDQLEGGEKAIVVTSRHLCSETKDILVSVARCGARFYELDGMHDASNSFPEIESLFVK